MCLSSTISVNAEFLLLFTLLSIIIKIIIHFFKYNFASLNPLSLLPPSRNWNK